MVARGGGGGVAVLLATEAAVLGLEAGCVEPLEAEAKAEDVRTCIGDTRGICITGVILSCCLGVDDRAPPMTDFDGEVSTLPLFFNSPVTLPLFFNSPVTPPPSTPPDFAPLEDWLGIDFPELKLV